MDVNSGTYAIGAGLKPEVTTQIIEAAEKKGFKLFRRLQGWAHLEYISMPKFFDLIKVVDGVLEARAKEREKEKQTPQEQIENKRKAVRSRKKTPETVE